MSEKPQFDVDLHGNCSKCGGMHFGTGRDCVYEKSIPPQPSAPASQGDALPYSAVYAVYNFGFLVEVFSARHEAVQYARDTFADSPECEVKMMELHPVGDSLRSERGGQDEAKELSDLLCPPHANLDKNNHLEPFDNCIACIRVERDELRKLLLRISTDIGQTIIEDPIKSAEGWVMMSKPVLADIAAVFEMPRIVPEPPAPPASEKEGICIHCRDGKHSSCCLVLCSCNCGGASGKGEE